MKYKLSIVSAGMIYIVFVIIIVCFVFCYTNISTNEPFWVYLIFVLLAFFEIYLLFAIISVHKVDCKSITIDKYDNKLILEHKNEGQIVISSESIKSIEIFARQVV